MPIGPVGPSRLAVPAVRAPRTLPSRAFAQLERLELKADERLEKASLRLEVPLDAVSPALRRDELQGLSVRIGAPVGTATVVPLEVVEKNGRAFLSVAAEGLDLASLRMTPLVLQLGEPELLLNPREPRVSSPFVRLQVTSPRLEVDMKRSVEQGLRERLAGLGQSLERVEQERRATAAGTSSWFGHRQLEGDLAAARTRLAQANQALPPLVAQATVEWERAGPMERVQSAPVDEARRAQWRAALVEASNAALALPEARALVESSRDVPELAFADGARVTALEEAVARGARVDAEVRRTFEGLAPEQQTFWLKALLPKSLPLAAALAAAFAASIDAGLEVTRLSEELAQLTATTTANVGPRLAALDQQLDGLRREQDALASRLAHFDAEPPALEALDVRYAPDVVVI